MLCYAILQNTMLSCNIPCYTIILYQFDSTRKRMSVMVEHQGKYLLLAKGADNVMKETRCTIVQRTVIYSNVLQYDNCSLIC